MGHKVNLGLLPFENRMKVHVANHQVSSLLSWSGKKAVEITSIQQSLGRVNALTEKIYAGSADEDQINRITRDGNQLILKDLEVTIEDKTLVTIDHLELEVGKVYAVTGDSGSGKTSLLSKIKGVKENGIGGSGYIYYPLINGERPKILMISQQDYFPMDSALLEVIFYPDEVPEDTLLYNRKIEEVHAILREIEFSEDAIDGAGERDKLDDNGGALNLDSIKDWYTALSGGEKKKVIIISAIIKRPNILILDEIFTGLDEGSIALIQKMLKKYLPDTLILVVDHHAQGNNFNFFYDKWLYLCDSKIIIKDIAEKT